MKIWLVNSDVYPISVLDEHAVEYTVLHVDRKGNYVLNVRPRLYVELANDQLANYLHEPSAGGDYIWLPVDIKSVHGYVRGYMKRKKD